MRSARSTLALLGVFLAAALVLAWSMSSPPVQEAASGNAQAPTDPASDGDDSAEPAVPADSPYWSDPAGVGQPYPPGTVTGLITFRGNPTRTYYGSGPIPRTAPVEAWRYPRSGGMCGMSIDEHGPMNWCGTGWTGQPAVFERDGREWLVFGAYDYGVHFLDANTGEEILPTFKTGDIIKGTVTVDPDGYPLVYTGSRDNNYRIIAIDGDKPRELWRLNADDVSPVKWNNDWDGSGLVIDDYLFEGGENSQFHIVKLNRGYGPDGKVTVKPELVFHTPGWDDQLLKDFGSDQVSIENSVAIYKDTVYFANSAGLVQGWDISGLKEGREPQRVFRFWTGDDTDASVVIDSDGFLYIGSEYEKHNARSDQVGQMVKLDPSKPDDPIVWNIRMPESGGVWGTPALYQDVVVYDTNAGDVLGVDRMTGAIRWKKKLPGPTWQSPVVIDGVLVLGDCDGTMHAYDMSDTSKDPPELWNVKIGGCIESTPAVWNGKMWFGTRDGQEHALFPADQVPANLPRQPASGSPQPSAAVG
ncbi:MAG: PQQ-binding-like beta-propeller repeat protein [Candidatus Nanopelagicales bacterium]